MKQFINRLHVSDCNEFMDLLPAGIINLTVTSPPYDKLRIYDGFIFDFKQTAENLYRVTAEGGVVVWVVGDQVIKGSETGTCFKQVLFFMELGFKLHDTMIWDKKHVFGTAGNPPLRYQQAFEYMFVFVKGKIKTFNPIIAPTIQKGRIYSGTTRRDRRSNTTTDCLTVIRNIPNKDTKIVNNIFTYEVGYNKTSTRKTAFDHPAIFPDRLASDHISTWSNPGDIVFDPFSGSGTTCEEAEKLGRRWMGCDISEKYITDSRKRLEILML